MEFGLDKCKICVMKQGKILHTAEDYQMENDYGSIKQIEPNEIYKYLGYGQTRGIDQKLAKSTLKIEYSERLKQIMKTKLNSKNKVTAINCYAIPVLTYSFGIIKWTDTELQELNRTTRRMCTKFGFHHPRSSKERFNLPRKKGGKGILDIFNMHFTQLQSLRQYFLESESSLHRAIVTADINYTTLKMANGEFCPVSKIINDETKVEQWQQKAIHGKYPNMVQQTYVDKEASYKWLNKGIFIPETEGFITAIQDGVIATKNYRKYIIKDTTLQDDKCRLCNSTSESIEHIISGCTILAPTMYTERHNNVAKIVHQNLCKRFKMTVAMIPYYKYKPPNVIENDQYKIYWDRPIVTDQTTPNNRPDIVVIDKIGKHTTIIDVTIPLASNIQKGYTNKIQKYLPLTYEIKKMWGHTTVEIVPIVLGACGEVPKSLLMALKDIKVPEQLYVEMQKAVILGTCNIVRTVIGNYQS